MLGLFGTLGMGARSLQTQQQGVQLAGHNLANVNNPAYARQRLALQTSLAQNSTLGPMGTGVMSAAVVRLRNSIVDDQITNETSISGSLEAQQSALQNAEAALGQAIDRQATGAEGAAAAQGVGGQHGIAEGLDDLFNQLQSLSTSPTSLSERQVLLMKASDLATKFNNVDSRLTELRNSLNDSVNSDVTAANSLLKQIAYLNDRIGSVERNTDAVANDLRDTRQAKVEELAKLMKFETSEGVSGSVNISVGGVSLVDGPAQVDTLETYDAGGGQMLVRTTTGATPLNLTAGSIEGTITARDGAIATLQSNLNTLAATVLTQVNAVHAGGYSLTGSTGANFFTGTGAADIKVNAALMNDPSLLQASGVPGTVGDNQNVLAMAQLANVKFAGLNNQTLSQNYGQTVATIGQALSSASSQLADQATVSQMLTAQRNSLSGVSLDEEMTDLVKYQKAFQASAKLITTVDELLDTVLSLKR